MRLALGILLVITLLLATIAVIVNPEDFRTTIDRETFPGLSFLVIGVAWILAGRFIRGKKNVAE